MTTRHGWTQADIAARVEQLTDELREVSRERCVVSLECGRGIASVIGFLAAVGSGNVPMLGSAAAPADRRARWKSVV